MWKSRAKAPKPPPPPAISRATFGKSPEGTVIDIYTLRNSKGAEARILTWGGIVTSLKVPDRQGGFGDVVLGYDDMESYLKNQQYFGALIGRYGNRIANGKFSLNGKTFTLPKNNGPNCLHGGVKGFDRVVWNAKPTESRLGPTLALTYISKDGEEGFPGNLKVTAVYSLTKDNALRLDFVATTDQPTLCNLTHHSYFNLAGEGNVLDHVIQIDAAAFTPVDANLIPTGELRLVRGTPFDFIAPMPLGARIDDDDEQLKLGHGYDHNYVLNKSTGQLGFAARVHEPVSGRVMDVLTTEPGVQFYSGNFIGDVIGKGGAVYHNRSGFCFEPQHFPDSPNRPAFPSTELKPGQTYQSTMIFRFSAL